MKDPDPRRATNAVAAVGAGIIRVDMTTFLAA
jgi:hypothetical protein